MKKIVLLVMFVMVLSFCACGGGKEVAADTADQAKTDETAGKTPETADEEAVDEEAVDEVLADGRMRIKRPQMKRLRVESM